MGGVPDGGISLKALRREVEVRLGWPEDGLLSLAELKVSVSAYYRAKEADRALRLGAVHLGNLD